MAEGYLTRQQLRTRSYTRLVHGVYADPSLGADHRLRCQGVALVMPDGAAIGGHSAAAWYGAPLAAFRDPVTVVCPRSIDWKGPRGVRVHRSLEPFDPVRGPDDVPLTTALRTAWETAALEAVGTAVAVLDAMVRAGHVDRDDLRSAVRDAGGRWGVTRVRRAVGLVDPRAESAPESRVRVARRLAGLDPVPQHEVWSDDVLVARVDLAFPEVRLGVEYEGAYHFEDGQIARDDVRYRRLREAGWTVVRVSAADLHDLDGLVARIRRALGALSAEKAG